MIQNEEIVVGNSCWKFADYQALNRDDRLAQRHLILQSIQQLPLSQRSGRQANVFADTCTFLDEWEGRCETSLERLERLLKNHDWFYQFSDDHRWWSAGQLQARHIELLVKECGPRGQTLYEAYSFEMYGKHMIAADKPKP